MDDYKKPRAFVVSGELGTWANIDDPNAQRELRWVVLGEPRAIPWREGWGWDRVVVGIFLTKRDALAFARMKRTRMRKGR